ncbi:MAG: hypothetical protein H0X50_12040 [Nitrosopumilus sp.]|nr:hypothetical protein [Nitrosopumilus sp.]
MSDNDGLLEFLITKVEETGIGAGLTLCVNGSIITGNLIKSRIYYDKMIEMYDFDKDQLTAKNAEELAKWNDYYAQYVSFINELKRQENQQNLKYIYLEHVTFRNVNSNIPIQAIVWRGKLSAVDGFSIGISSNPVL